MTNWLSTGTAFDGVIADNDESAIGAIQALKAGVAMDAVVVAASTPPRMRLPRCRRENSTCRCSRTLLRRGPVLVDAAVKLAKGEAVEQQVWVPFELVTPANINDYLKKN